MVRSAANAHVRRATELLALCTALVLTTGTSSAQDLGHKVPGTIGLDAGKVPEPGLYVVDRVVYYRADELRDRHGELLAAAGLDLRILANAVGIAGTVQLPWLAIRLTAAVAVPVASVSLHSDKPEASLDRFGLTDVYVRPLKLGWQAGRWAAVGGYGLYVPTGLPALAGGTGLSAGQLTHEFAGGGSIFFDANRAFGVTALASYELNMRKHAIDITRGDTVQIQGGLGGAMAQGLLELGVAGYALWQVRDDRGGDLPPALAGARDRVYGLGPEVAISVRTLRSQVRLRYELDLGVQSRPVGQILILGLNVLAWRPKGQAVVEQAEDVGRLLPVSERPVCVGRLPAPAP